MHEMGVSRRQIAIKVKRSPTTISTIIKRWEEGHCYKRKKGSGRKKKLSAIAERYLLREILKNRRATLPQIVNMVPEKVSVSTIKRTLHSAGFRSRVAKVKPYLSQKHLAGRLAFAKKHENWTLNDWKKVLWTDEVSFEKGKNTRRIRVWRRILEEYLPQCLVPSFKSNRSSVMIWGGIMYGKKTEMTFFEKYGPNERRMRTTGADYVKLVYDGPLKKFIGRKRSIVLMEDGAPIHRCNVSKAWLAKKKIKTLDWPANSPDLNPIENLWRAMKIRVQERTLPHMTLDEFRIVIKDVWNEFGAADFDKYIETMPERIQAVLKAKGGSTKW